MKSDEVIALLAVEQLFEIRENAKEDGDIHPSVEQDRAPHAVCFLHDISPGQRQRENDGQEDGITCSVGYGPVHQGEYKGDQENRNEIPEEWLQLAQEQSPEPEFFQCAVSQSRNQ